MKKLATIFAAVALLAACAQPAQAPTPPEPDTFALTYDTLAGDRFVFDHDLSLDDCMDAMHAAMKHYQRGIGCEIERN